MFIFMISIFDDNARKEEKRVIPTKKLPIP
jgi:hypothetical protein